MRKSTVDCHHANRVKKKEKVAFSYRELADVVGHAEPAGVEEQRFVQ